MSDWETIYHPAFTVLENTLWWECPVCYHKEHATWETGLSKQHTGYDFSCEQGCDMRHCVVWQEGTNSPTDATIYSYHRLIADKRGLPLLARL